MVYQMQNRQKHRYFTVCLWKEFFIVYEKVLHGLAVKTRKKGTGYKDITASVLRPEEANYYRSFSHFI